MEDYTAPVHYTTIYIYFARNHKQNFVAVRLILMAIALATPLAGWDASPAGQQSVR